MHCLWYYLLFVAICEIWFLKLIYDAYLILSLKSGITQPPDGPARRALLTPCRGRGRPPAGRTGSAPPQPEATVVPQGRPAIRRCHWGPTSRPPHRGRGRGRGRGRKGRGSTGRGRRRVAVAAASGEAGIGRDGESEERPWFFFAETTERG